jgi:3,4-dihydroxy 2-butanone 4-phosphate synthase/GTP cyclohydrolase II
MEKVKTFVNIEEAIHRFHNGEMLIVVDDEDRENEGDFIISAEKASVQDINFMIKVGRGLICVAITTEHARKLDLSPMVSTNTAKHQTNFTVSVDAAQNITTGISAKDRWETIQVILNKSSTSNDLAKPGHMFPLTAKKGGVLQRAGHTEAAVDLAKISSMNPVSLLVEIIDEDGSMARRPKLEELALEHGLLLITIADLIEYRRKNDKLVTELSNISLPNKFGEFNLRLFEDTIHGDHHIALVKGDFNQDEEVLVRVHSQCLTGDIFGSMRCDCGEQLDGALKRIEKEGKGLLVYLRQEGRGIGLKNKIMAYKLQETGLDTVEANHALGFPDDLREYGIGAQIISECGVRKMKLLTNNPRKIIGLEGYDLEVVGREDIECDSNPENKKYLQTKRDKLGHFILDED